MMKEEIEARYLNVEWLDHKTVASLSCSLDPLEIYEEEGTWKIDTHVFKGYFSRIGFRVLNQKLVHRPYFFVDQNSVEELLDVVDPSTGETWWIQNSGWDSNKCRYNSELQRTVGTAKLCVQNLHITIINHSSNFTLQELEAYLSDFKADLWLIIFNPQGRVKGKIEKGMPNILGEDLVRLLHEFVGIAEKISENLVVELKEVVEKKPVRSVKPITKTFIEVASRGYAKQLSSRAFVEMADTSDNRYVHHILSRLLFMIDQLIRMAMTQKFNFKKMANHNSSWRDDLLSQTQKIIPKKVFFDELDKLDEKINNERRAISTSVPAGNTNLSRYFSINKSEYYTFQFGKLYGKSETDLFCNKLLGKNFKEEYKTYCVVSLPKNLAIQVEKLSSDNHLTTIKLNGIFSERRDTDSKGIDFHRIEYEYVESVEFPDDTVADIMRKKIPKLEASNWLVALTFNEKEERKKEAQALEKRRSLLDTHVSELDGMLKELNSFSRRLGKVATTFRNRKVGKSARFPNSMTFVRNPGYFLIKSSHEKIKNLSGIEDDIVNSMTVIDEISLVNVSNLYEKWCLLQIIKVLRDGFGFQLEGEWQRSLVNSVLNREHNICLQFKGASPNWTAQLFYEKVLTNNCRPDFVLDLFLPCYEQSELPNSNKWFTTGNRSVRIVMDAKFREQWRPGELAQVVTDLRVKKDYSEQNKNQVFILHPCIDSSEQHTSPLTWGSSCDYGQTNNHKSGAIYLSPRRTNGSSLDNLHRLLGMLLQEASHFLHEHDTEGWKWSDAQCIGCGRVVDFDKVQLTLTKTKAGRDKWNLTCHHCQLVSVRTSCFKCHRTLTKNGYYWTYHRTRAESLSNVVCPSCESFFDGFV